MSGESCSRRELLNEQERQTWDEFMADFPDASEAHAYAHVIAVRQRAKEVARGMMARMTANYKPSGENG